MRYFKVYSLEVSGKMPIIKVGDEVFHPESVEVITEEELETALEDYRAKVDNLDKITELSRNKQRTHEEDEELNRLREVTSSYSNKYKVYLDEIKIYKELCIQIELSEVCNAVVCAKFEFCNGIDPVSNASEAHNMPRFGEPDDPFEEVVHVSTYFCESETYEQMEDGELPRLTHVKINDQRGFDYIDQLPDSVKSIKIDFARSENNEVNFDGEIILKNCPKLKTEKLLNVVEFHYNKKNKLPLSYFANVDYSKVRKVSIDFSEPGDFEHFNELKLMNNLEEIRFTKDICEFPEDFKLESVTKISISKKSPRDLPDQYGTWKILGNLNQVFPNLFEFDRGIKYYPIPKWCSKLVENNELGPVVDKIHIKRLKPIKTNEEGNFQFPFFIPTSEEYEITVSLLHDSCFNANVPERLLPQVHFINSKAKSARSVV